MKQSTLYLQLFLLIICINACSGTAEELKDAMSNSGSRISFSDKEVAKSDNPLVMVYDYNQETSDFNLITVEIKTNPENINEALVQAFLDKSHFIKKQSQVDLLRIEELEGATIFYLTDLNGFENPVDAQLFKKALELTIMRHLKHSDFQVVYG